MNLLKLSFVSAALLTSSLSFGASKLRYSADCNIDNPREHESDVGYVYRVEVIQTGNLDAQNRGSATLKIYRSAFFGSEELQVPRGLKGEATFVKLTDGSTGLSGFSGSWDEGDTWIDTKFDRQAKSFKGTFTLEEDFLFKTTCKLNVKFL